MREKFYSQKFCHPACPPVEEVAFDEGSLYLSLKSRDVSPGEKRLNMTRKRLDMQSESEEVLVKADVNRDILKEV